MKYRSSGKGEIKQQSGEPDPYETLCLALVWEEGEEVGRGCLARVTVFTHKSLLPLRLDQEQVSLTTPCMHPNPVQHMGHSLVLKKITC